MSHVRVQSGNIYKKVNGTSLWHMLWLIPRTAVSKKASNLIVTASSQNKGSPLVCLAFLPPAPQSEDLTPNNTIEYANYLHIKSTPRKTKSMAQTLYKDAGLGSERPKPHFCQLDFLALKGAGVRHTMEMILKWYIQNPCKSSSLDRGEELGHGCFRQLKSKGIGIGEEGQMGRRPTDLPRQPWGGVEGEDLALRTSISLKRNPLLWPSPPPGR